jgi:2-C-methyl-D-erythritol 4-phosphate cytidylyltransferase
MGGPVRKPLLPLGGTPLLFRTLGIFRAVGGIEEIVLALHPDDCDAVREEHAGRLDELGVTLVVAGGANRAETVWRALEVSNPDAALVAVHDAVRPFCSRPLVRALLATAARTGAAVPVLPLRETLKRVEADRVLETVDRAGLYRVQTPQVFRREALVEAYAYARRTGGLSDRITDDASLVERAGERVTGILGEGWNLKITTPGDLRFAEMLLAGGIADALG